MKAHALKPESHITGRFLPAQLLPKNTVWRAFQAGMGILYRYASRSRADSASIAKANLQLLHRTLLTDPSYREALTKAELEKSKHGLPNSHNLLFSQGLRAELITIRQGYTSQLSSCEDSICMFLVVSGQAAINQAKDSRGIKAKQHKPWWGWFNHSSTKKLNKVGDFILLYPGNHERKVLSALENNCILLSVTLPIDHRAANR